MRDSRRKLYKEILTLEEILIELQKIRANALLTVGDKGRTRDRLRDLIEKIEGATG